jgi:hypothetical protein
MTLWESLYCIKDDDTEMVKVEAESIAHQGDVYECPKCHIKVKLLLTEDYDE